MNYLPLFTKVFVEHEFQVWFNPIREGIGVSYKGEVVTTRWGNIQIEFYFDDKTLSCFPKAYILNRTHSELQPYYFPHLESNWSLCFDDGVKVFDKYNPKGMVLYCIDKVRHVLNEIQPNDFNEILPEFRAYWEPSLPRYFGNIKDKSETVYFNHNKCVGEGKNIWGINTSECDKQPLFIINNIPPFQENTWPIVELKQLKTWLKDYPDTLDRISQFIKNKILSYHDNFKLVLYSKSEQYYLGINIEIQSSLLKKKTKPHLQSNTINRIFKKSTKIKSRFWIENYSEKNLLSSNIDESVEKNLSDKKILLVGVGTIGSNLANILVRNGAGSGENGSLSIIDNDFFDPCNFSRHFLGLESTGRLKADALKDELNRITPWCNIIPINKSIYEIQIKLSEFDIIIDSTGEEALTMWLNEKLFQSKTLFISTWVRGKGEAVEAFVINELNVCHECFRQSPHAKNSNKGELPLRGSCNSVFVPFPISVSLYSSLLVINIINKWLEEELDENNFFRQEMNPVNKIESIDIDKNTECSVCGISCIEV